MFVSFLVLSFVLLALASRLILSPSLSSCSFVCIARVSQRVFSRCSYYIVFRTLFLLFTFSTRMIFIFCVLSFIYFCAMTVLPLYRILTYFCILSNFHKSAIRVLIIFQAVFLCFKTMFVLSFVSSCAMTVLFLSHFFLYVSNLSVFHYIV